MLLGSAIRVLRVLRVHSVIGCDDIRKSINSSMHTIALAYYSVCHRGIEVV